ncbi:MAG: transglutaminase domain-containing protein [Bacteroidota bacterium]|jgi:hypothetical protein
MKKQLMAIAGAILIISSCVVPTPIYQTKLVGISQKEALTYNTSTMNMPQYYTGTAYSTPDRLKAALKEKQNYPDNTPFYAAYVHTSYEFQFVKDSVEVGKPVQVYESNQEKIVSLVEGTKFMKSEYFSENTDFKGFYVNLQEDRDTGFVKSIHAESQIGSGGIFYSDAKIAHAAWDLPGIGSSIRVRNNKLHDDAKYVTTVYFHETYPVKERVLTFKIPVWMEIEFLERNFTDFSITKTETPFVIGMVAKGDKSNNKINSGNSKNNKNNKSTKPEIQYKHVTYTIKDTKPLKDESLYPGPSHDLPHLIVLCKSYDSTAAYAAVGSVTDKSKNTKKDNKKKDKKTKRELPKNIKGTIASTADLYTWSHEIALLADNDLDTIKPAVMKIVEGKQTDLDKVEAVFYWVQDNIRYVAFEDGIAAFKPDACQNVLSKKYGDCKGMANLIKSMLVVLGYDARLVWIGTHRLNYDYSIPTVGSSNHMICALFLNGKTYYLDGTEKFIGLEDYAHRIQGRPVMIENGESYIIDTVPNLHYTRNQHDRTANFVIQEDGKITGKVMEVIRGENKTSLLNKYHYAETPDKPYVIKQHLKDYDPNFIATNVKHTGLEDRKSDLRLDYDLTINFNGIKNGSTIYVKPDYTNELKNHDNDTARMSKIAYGHKLYYTHNYTFDFPKNYKVKQLPQNFSIDRPEYTFTITYKQMGAKIYYTKELVLKTGYISKSNVKQWNADLTSLEAQYNNYIVLDKQ